ncbi:hypothetical protein ACNKHK_04135 [Shigella flexneri]
MTGVFPVSVLGRADSDGDVGRRYRTADARRPVAGYLPEDVVMDGITSPIKADPEWQKPPLTACLHCAKPTLSILYGILLVLRALHLPRVQRRDAGSRSCKLLAAG